MSTLLQLLRVAFWTLPVQRVLTVAGALMVFIGFSRQQPGAFQLPAVLSWGLPLLLALPLLLGGAWLRILSAPRFMQLLPHARGRLLGGTVMVVILGTLATILVYWLANTRFTPPRFRPMPEYYLLTFMLTLTFATQCVIGVFIAARGPVWLAVALILWTAPQFVLPWLGIENRAEMLAGPAGIAMVGGTWLAFAGWFLTTRRINGEGWRRGNVSAPAVAAAMAAPAMSREQAMTRWLLGAATPWSIGLLWTAGVALLLGIQLLIGRESPPRAVIAVAFGTLSLNAVVIAAMAHAAGARSRGLWLTGARLREALFTWCERLLVRVAVAILLPFLVLGAALWWWLPERPALPLAYLLPAIAAPGLMALWLGLLSVRRSFVLSTMFGLSIVASWYYGVAKPLADGAGDPPWVLLGGQFAVMIVLRFLAAHRWRSLDWPRGGRVEPVG